jgi:hypothetical protein
MSWLLHSSVLQIENETRQANDPIVPTCCLDVDGHMRRLSRQRRSLLCMRPLHDGLKVCKHALLTWNIKAF